jgi:hypothetical protein
LYGRTGHRRQVAPKLDLECVPALVRRQHDGVDEAAQHGANQVFGEFGLKPAANILRELVAEVRK